MSRRITESLHALSLGVACFLAAGLVLATATAAQQITVTPATQPAAAGQPAPTTRPAIRFNVENTFKNFRSRIDDNLKLTDEQKAKVDALFDKAIADAKAIEADASMQLQEKMPKIAQLFKQLVDDVKNDLDENQKALFDKAFPMGRGPGGGGPQAVITRFEDVLAKLDLSPEQKEKIDKATAEFRGKMAEVVQQAGGNGPSDESRQKMQSLVGDYRDQVLGILSDEQKAKFRDLLQQARPAGGGPNAAPSAATQAKP